MIDMQSWAMDLLGAALVLLGAAVLGIVLGRAEKRGGMWKSVALAGERLAAVAVLAAEKQIQALIAEGKMAIGGIDAKTLADTLYNRLPDNIIVDGAKLPIGVFKRWFPQGAWEEATAKALVEVEGLIGRIEAAGVAGTGDAPAGKG